MNVWKRRSLRIKLVAVSILIEIVLVVLLTAQGVQRTREEIASNYAVSISELLPVLQSALVAPVVEEDIDTISAVINPLIATEQSHFVAVEIFNRHQDLLFTSNSSLQLKADDHLHPGFQPSHFLHTLSSDRPSQYLTAIPLSLASEPVGTMVFALRTSHISATLTQISRYGLFVGTLAALLGGGVFWLVGMRLTNVLKTIHHAAEQIRRGDYQSRIAIEREDELGRLAVAFNLMAARIETDHRTQFEREQNILFTLNSIVEGVIAIDNDARISQINPVAAELIGGDPEQYRGRLLEESLRLLDPISGQPLVAPILTALREGETLRHPKAMKLVDSEDGHHPIVATAAPVLNAENQVVGAIMVFRDNTEEQKQQLILRRNQEQFNAAEQVAEMGSWSRDLQSGELHWSKGLYRIVGIDESDLNPSIEKFAHRLSTTDRAQLFSAAEKARAGVDTPLLTLTLASDNGPRQLDVRFETFYDDQRQPRRIVGIVLDTTDRIATEKARHESEQMLLSVMNNAPALVVVKNRDGRILHSNETHAKIFGTTAEQLVGKTSYDFHPADEARTIEARDRQVFESGKRLELVETLFDGKEPRLFSNSRTPLVDENGEVYALVFIGFDVTETAEQEQRANNRVRMEALGKLTGGVAHDYNNMLAIILGYAELLLQSATENSETAQYADEILRAGNRGASLTKKLLAFARQQPGNTEQADINDVLRNNQEMLEKTLTSQIELELKLAPEPMLVEVDLAELEDAIINLAINAMQAMPEGGRLTITTGQRRASAKLIQKSFLQAGEYVLLTVSDDGIGMKEEILSRIFEPFFTTKGEQGTGLGLSQVYGFVRRSGGDIQVTSTPGKGSRFELYFPISKNLQRPQESEIRPSLIGAKKQPEESPHRHHILVVDDEPALVALTEELLSSHGYRVTAVGDPGTALELLSTDQAKGIDLLITDVVMPQIDGFTLAEQARKQRPELKVIFVSGYNTVTSITPVAGFTDTLAKPFQTADLLARTATMLKQSNDS